MALPRSFAAIFSLSLLASACGASRAASESAKSDGSGDADAMVDENAGGDAALDAAEADADAGNVFCLDSPDGGALSAPEVVASGRSGLEELEVSSAGPIWLETDDYWFAKVVLSVPETTSPRVLYDSRKDGVVWGTTRTTLRVNQSQFSLLLDYLSDGLLVLGSAPTGSSTTCPAPKGIASLAVDDSQVFALLRSSLQLDAHWWVYGYPSAEACAAGGSMLYDLGGDWPDAITTDGADVCVYVEPCPDVGGCSAANAAYEIRCLPKSGGAATLFAVGVAPAPLFMSAATLVAHDGTIAWASGGSAIVAYNPQWSHPRALADEKSGIGFWHFAGDGRLAIAVDDEYLYWTSLDGFVKRVRLCGGTPEILASNQDQPIAIAVDDNAVYWLDHGTQPGTGKVMRMRKLDAPGYPDASTDAGIADASAGDADASD